MPDVPRWREYANRVTFRGRSGGAEVTLIESVRHDRPRRLTTFDERYVERRGSRLAEKRFSLVFRSVSIDDMQRQLTRIGLYADKVDGKAGMKTRAALGAYQKSAGLKVDCWPSEAVLRSLRSTR